MKKFISFLLSLGYVLLIADCAHTQPLNADAVNNLHAKATTTDDFSAVENWQLVCEQLCGANLGGPACGEQCPAKAFDNEVAQKQAALFGDSKTIICSELCANGLANTDCSCDTANVSTSSSPTATVCQAFCQHNNITLKGCKNCVNLKMSNASLLSKMFYFEEAVAQSTTLDPEEPDWDKMCVGLCKVGEGGTLCNCDLPPFF